MRKILIPINLTDCAEQSCLFGINLAEKIKADLYFIHCFVHTGQGLELGNEFGAIPEDAEAAFDGYVDEIRNKLSHEQRSKIKLYTHFTTGNPVKEILHYSNEISPNLVIISTNSLGDRIKKAIGSLSFQIVQSLNVPILSIPADYNVNLEGDFKIGMVLNFNKKDVLMLDHLNDLLEDFQFDLQLINHCPFGNQEFKSKKEEAIKNEIHKRYEQSITQTHLIEDEDYLKGLNELAKQLQFDLLVVNNKKQSFISRLIPGVAKSLFFAYDRPLLILKE